MNKKPKLARDSVGLKVRAKRDLWNGYLTIKAGTILTVREKYGSLRLEGPRCKHCGVAVWITRVPVNAVEIVAARRE